MGQRHLFLRSNIRIEFLLAIKIFNVPFMLYSTRVKLRNCRRTLFTFEHTTLPFWQNVIEKRTRWLFWAGIDCFQFGFFYQLIPRQKIVIDDNF